jgi:hypothetical protein
MDIEQILSELRSERQHIEEAILVLERLGMGSGKKRRGRPPKWITDARTEQGEQSEPEESEPRKRTVSPEARARMAAAQRRRWAAARRASS